MRYLKFVSAVLLVVVAVGCGKSEAEKQSEETAKQLEKAAAEFQKAADAAEKGSTGAAEGMEAFAKATAAAAAGAAAGSDGKAADPVSFQQLETVLPELSGWEREKPRGERMTMPVPFSQTETTYNNGDARVEVKIVDSAFNQLLVLPWAIFMSAGYSRETSEGYEKATNVNGNPGFERWNSKDGELNIVVAKRFLVTIEGNNLNDMKALHEFASRLTPASWRN